MLVPGPWWLWASKGKTYWNHSFQFVLNSKRAFGASPFVTNIQQPTDAFSFLGITPHVSRWNRNPTARTGPMFSKWLEASGCSASSWCHPLPIFPNWCLQMNVCFSFSFFSNSATLDDYRRRRIHFVVGSHYRPIQTLQTGLKLAFYGRKKSWKLFDE